MDLAAPRSPIAHAPLDASAKPDWLVHHSVRTARLATSFLPPGLDPAWGNCAGFHHDLGKARSEWQAFIHAAGEQAVDAHIEESDPKAGRKKGPPHSPEGALRLLWEAGGGDLRKGFHDLPATILAWVVFGHHGGLKDRETLKSSLHEFAENWKNDPGADAFLQPVLKALPRPSLPAWVKAASTKDEGMRRLDLMVRMIFSALVDADFLDTEAYFARAGNAEASVQVEARSAELPSMAELLAQFEISIARLDASSAAEGHASVSAINQLRREVRQACCNAAAWPPGLLTLTVPTGGAKTLGSLAFGLHHARQHGKKRVIVAVPFTSITEQTASTFRDYLPSFAVLEHHSNLDPAKETARSRVASENWDAPVIVTTQVQLFESLLANRTSRCRKLHNLCESVLILDEVQSLPMPYLLPILDLLDDLARNYGTTILLTTATQPELHARALGGQAFRGLAHPPREIIPHDLAEALWASLRRVRVHWPDGWEGDLRPSPTPWADLARRMAGHDQALAITHLKADALNLAKALEVEGLRPYHLSTSMCPAHRRVVLKKLRFHLDRHEPCHLVSTQLIEAGVDIDFPVVYRAMAGLEALAQSAGRCNRNGRLAPELGDFFIFEAPTEPPRDLQTARDIARSMLLNGQPDLLAPGTFVDYFARLHAAKGDLLDRQGIQALRAALQFEKVAEQTRLVDTPAEPVFVPYDDEARESIATLRWRGPSQQTLRRLQPYTVNLFPRQMLALQQQGALGNAETFHGFQVLVSDMHYHPVYGLCAEADSSHALIP